MTYEANKINTEIKTDVVDFDPNATSVTDCVKAGGAFYDMKNYTNLRVLFIRTVGASTVTLKIRCSDAPATGGNEADVVTKTFTVGQPDGVADFVTLECQAEQIAQLSATDGRNYRYVFAEASFATGTDEAVVVYERMGAKHKFNGLTTDYIS